MISDDLIQAAIVTTLKANSTLTAWLSARSSADEIREASFQGAVFEYPSVRVQLGTQTEAGNPPCYSTLPFTLWCFSESDSSREADQLAGLVYPVLLRQKFSGTGFTSGLITATGGGILKATRVSNRVWRAGVQLQCNIYGGDF